MGSSQASTRPSSSAARNRLHSKTGASWVMAWMKVLVSSSPSGEGVTEDVLRREVFQLFFVAFPVDRLVDAVLLQQLGQRDAWHRFDLNGAGTGGAHDHCVAGPHPGGLADGARQRHLTAGLHLAQSAHRSTSWRVDCITRERG